MREIGKLLSTLLGSGIVRPSTRFPGSKAAPEHPCRAWEPYLPFPDPGESRRVGPSEPAAEGRAGVTGGGH